MHSWAANEGDAAVMPRLGAVGKRKIVDEGPLAPFPNMQDLQNWRPSHKAKYNMETFDDVLIERSGRFMGKAGEDGKPFFIWHSAARMHVFTYLAPEYQALMDAKNNYHVEEATPPPNQSTICTQVGA